MGAGGGSVLQSVSGKPWFRPEAACVCSVVLCTTIELLSSTWILYWTRQELEVLHVRTQLSEAVGPNIKLYTHTHIHTTAVSSNWEHIWHRQPFIVCYTCERTTLDNVCSWFSRLCPEFLWENARSCLVCVVKQIIWHSQIHMRKCPLWPPFSDVCLETDALKALDTTRLSYLWHSLWFWCLYPSLLMHTHYHTRAHTENRWDNIWHREFSFSTSLISNLWREGVVFLIRLRFLAVADRLQWLKYLWNLFLIENLFADEEWQGVNKLDQLTEHCNLTWQVN